MKIHQFVLLPLALAFFGAVHALPDKDGNEEDCPHYEEEDEEDEDEAAAAAQAAADAEILSEPFPSYCDEAACRKRIDDHIALVEHEGDMVSQRLEVTKKFADEKMALTDEFKGKIREQEQITEESKSAEETAKRELEASKKSIQDSESSLASCNSSTEQKIKALEEEIAAAKAEAAEFSGSRFFVNVDLIKSEFKGLLKKVGIGKDEL